MIVLTRLLVALSACCWLLYSTVSGQDASRKGYDSMAHDSLHQPWLHHTHSPCHSPDLHRHHLHHHHSNLTMPGGYSICEPYVPDHTLNDFSVSHDLWQGTSLYGTPVRATSGRRTTRRYAKPKRIANNHSEAGWVKNPFFEPDLPVDPIGDNRLTDGDAKTVNPSKEVADQ